MASPSRVYAFTIDWSGLYRPSTDCEYKGAHSKDRVFVECKFEGDKPINDIQCPMRGSCSSNNSYEVWLGPVELPGRVYKRTGQAETKVFEHSHGMVTFTTAVRPSKAREVILFVLELEDGRVQYLDKVRKSREIYLQYCYKSLDKIGEDPVLTSIKRVKARGVLKTADVISDLVSIHGPIYAKKRRADVVFQVEHFVDIDDDECSDRMKRFREIGKSTCTELASVEYIEWLLTTFDDVVDFWKFEYCDWPSSCDFIKCLALLPILCGRCEGDELPSLYLYGSPKSGKSYLFNHFKDIIKMIPGDAEGVSRFDLSGVQRCLLLDDVPADFVVRQDNSMTLRSLTLGEYTDVKIAGDTRRIMSWIVVTSNDLPVFMTSDAMSRENVGANSRRFFLVDTSGASGILSRKAFRKRCRIDLDNEEHVMVLIKWWCRWFNRLTASAIRNDKEVSLVPCENLIKRMAQYYDILTSV